MLRVTPGFDNEWTDARADFLEYYTYTRKSATWIGIYVQPEAWRDTSLRFFILSWPNQSTPISLVFLRKERKGTSGDIPT